MRTLFGQLLVAFFIVINFALPAFAIGKEKKVLVIPRPCQIQGQNLVPGTYTAEFEANKPGQLVLSDGRKEVARIKYNPEQLDKPATGDRLEFSNQDGVRQIVRIEFKGLTNGLRFEASQAAEPATK
ncbi:MAG TPA: hypothetical protein PLL06_14185 [Acidobacteriota bacterium]|nr:hypothetical protein [Acidobacteriota bacterium]HMZ80848.1 hypothetical protein [Acidobacteriota bacterium]HNB72824.1 hypothetical protein [Acidobacteriota bacterium]HND21900.1 hypothetical protein [Acidobacteriota bacterium]HNG94907.1 hypothetical protein [Acidobacteriota bacterium]